LKRLLIILSIFALSAAYPVGAAVQRPKLAAVASVFAERPVRVKCYQPEELDAPEGIGAWGYVNIPLAKARYMHVSDVMCNAARDVNGDAPRWQRALGVLVIVHEAYHLRRWGAAGDEAKVECRAIRHWRVGARLLGATEETVTELWPYAIAYHYRLTGYEDLWSDDRPYYDPGCDVPPIGDE